MTRPLLAVALVLLACRQSEPEPEPEPRALPPELAALVPSDAFGLAVLRSAAEAAAQLEAARAEAGLDTRRIDAPSVLRELLDPFDFTLDAAQLDLGRPIAIAYTFGRNSSEPLSTWILPALDPESLIAALASEQGYAPAVRAGSYVAVSQKELVPRHDGRARVLAQFPDAPLAARIDLDAVIRKFRPAIDMGLDALEQQASTLESELHASELLEDQVELGRAFFDSADLLDVVIEMRGPDLALGVAVLSREGTAMAKLARPEALDFAELARHLDPEAPLHAITAYDGNSKLALYWTAYADLLDDLEPEVLEPAVLSGWKRLVAHAKACSDALGRVNAWSVDLRGTGWRSALTTLTADPKPATEALRALARDPALAAIGLATAECADVEVAGTKGTLVRWKLEHAFFESSRALMGALVGSAVFEPSEEGPEELQQVVDAFFGRDGLAWLILPGSDRVHLLAGGDDAWRSRVARRAIEGGEVPSSLQRAVATIEGSNPAMLVHLDVARGLAGLAEWMALVNQSDALALFDVASLARALGKEPLPASFHWGARERTLRVGAAIELAGLMRCIGAANRADGMADRRRRAVHDVAVITAALDRYAAAHAGRSPESLEVLLEQDSEGQSPLAALPKDPWGRPYLYEGAREGAPHRVRSLGADGKPGGTGEDADVRQPGGKD